MFLKTVGLRLWFISIAQWCKQTTRWGRHTTCSICKLLIQPPAGEPNRSVTSDMQKLPRDFIMTGSRVTLISLVHLQRWSWTTHIVPPCSTTCWMDHSCILQGCAAGATEDEFHFYISYIHIYVFFSIKSCE